jgi:hypothetical protein
MAMNLARKPRVLASIAGTSSISISVPTAGWNGFALLNLLGRLAELVIGRFSAIPTVSAGGCHLAEHVRGSLYGSLILALRAFAVAPPFMAVPA